MRDTATSNAHTAVFRASGTEVTYEEIAYDEIDFDSYYDPKGVWECRPECDWTRYCWDWDHVDLDDARMSLLTGCMGWTRIITTTKSSVGPLPTAIFFNPANPHPGPRQVVTIIFYSDWTHTTVRYINAKVPPIFQRGMDRRKAGKEADDGHSAQ